MTVPWRNAHHSALYPLGAALVALSVGASQAWLAERTDASFRQILYVAAMISLGVPYVLYIVAWLLLLSKAGPVNDILQHLFGGSGPYIDVYSLGGMMFVEGMLWSPLAFLLLSPVFRNSDASFEEAASICGAGLFSTLRHITMGMVRPALLAFIQIHPELEEAAAIAGARQGTAFFQIVLPLLVPAMISCWLFVFLIAVRAVSLMLLLVGPDLQIVAVTLFDLWNNRQIGELAALGCVWTAIMARRYQLPLG